MGDDISKGVALQKNKQKKFLYKADPPPPHYSSNAMDKPNSTILCLFSNDSLWPFCPQEFHNVEQTDIPTHGRRTLKTPIPNVVFSVHFCLGLCRNFVGCESGQKQSVQLLQNMVYTTTQHPPPPSPPPPPTATHCLVFICCTFTLGGGDQREGRGATVHKRGSFIHGGNSSQTG